MLTSIIRFSLQQRLLVMVAAATLILLGIWRAAIMPIDVFPDLNRPRVVIMTEAPGMAPEEVESLITLPIETAMNGANGVEAVRSSSAVGISVIYVEFDYGTDVYTDRQIVSERLQMIQDRIPRGISPQLAPISSIMGQILMLGMWHDDPNADSMELRTNADWVVRQRLLTIPGVAQVFTMGGQRKQIQVLVDPEAMLRYGVSLAQIEKAVSDSNENGTGGYLDRQGPNELLVRSLGRLESLDDLRKVPVTTREGRPVQLSQVAEIREGPQVKRGDSSAFVRAGLLDGTNDQRDRNWRGGPAVVLTINKQPGADTRVVSDLVMQAIEELKTSLPAGTQIMPLYAQKAFIDRAIENVAVALRDGALLVVVILFLFLMNVRTTLITLTAIPLSLVMTVLVFATFGLSINTMTLGGLAVAMGELVDDAIVDVENIHRRLKENRLAQSPLSPLVVVFQASIEVRRSIVYGTLVVILVFIPLFALGGMEGRLFAPLGVAYIVSILASLLVSLTVTPVLAYWFLGQHKAGQQGSGQQASGRDDGDSLVLRLLKRIGERVIRFSLWLPVPILVATGIMVAIAGACLWRIERDFLPPFNEGTIQLNVVLDPGTSLSASNAIVQTVERALQRIDDVERFARRTGRAELDEHAEGVNMTEFLIELDPDSPRNRQQQLAEIRAAMAEIPGIATAVEQPIAHLISHMISGVKAQVGIKVFGQDLEMLRRTADELKASMSAVRGVADVMIERQVLIPQLRIELDRDQLLRYGLTTASVNNYIQTAMNGTIVSEVLENMRTFDLLVRMKDSYRENLQELRRLSIQLPDGGTLPLSALARIVESDGPNTVNRENISRRILIQCNVTGRGVVDTVADIRQAIAPTVAKLPPGYFVEYGGQFQNQQAASRTLGLLFAISVLGIFCVLYSLFRSVNLSLQVMAALPMAFIGSVAALVLTNQTLTIASMVGFISLSGIASRNGILLLQHYMHLVQYEGEQFTPNMIVRGGLERLAPVLMTALTAGIGLVPLVIAGDQAGKEILYPVATVILGGVISSTLLDFFVHPALFWLFGRRAVAAALRDAV
ncbi:MAG: efflux RND transporter permease subunit [Pirellulaceae bacterium]|nr:efflux RND transporter permease subunit [Pirellulaceae bacterium]